MLVFVRWSLGVEVPYSKKLEDGLEPETSASGSILKPSDPSTSDILLQIMLELRAVGGRWGCGARTQPYTANLMKVCLGLQKRWRLLSEVSSSRGRGVERLSQGLFVGEMHGSQVHTEPAWGLPLFSGAF